MPKNSNSSNKNSNQTIAIVVLTVILAIGVGFFVLGNRTNDPTIEDLDLNAIGSQLGSDTFQGDLNSEFDESMQDPLADGTYLSQPQNGEAQPEQPGQRGQSDPAADPNQPITNQQNPSMIDKTNMPQPEMSINPNAQYFATMTTNMGIIKLELFASETPKTVNNFVYLAQNNFFDGLIFHRVIPDFMIQGGCPLGSGMGGPGYKFEDEQNSAPLVEGSLAMANSGPNTNGSQFFIVTADATPWLDGLHTHFGRVVEGLEVVQAIEKTPTGTNDKPVQDVVIQSVEISQN